jgi:hypothetical protein
MKTLKVMLPAAVLAAGFMVCTTSSYGTPAYAKKEGKTCNYCHGKVEAKENMPKNLTDTGKCYQKNEHKDLAKCPVPAAPEKK